MNKSGFFPAQSGAFEEIDAEIILKMVATSSDFCVIVDADGVVERIVLGSETLIGDDLLTWRGAPFRSTLTEESLPKYDALLTGAAGDGPPKWRQLNHATLSETDLPVAYAAQPGEDPGTVLLLGRDKRELMQLQNRLVQSQLTIEQDYERIRQVESRYRVLFETGSDALVILSADTGRVGDINSAAARLLKRDAQEIKGRPLSGLIAPGSAESFSEMIETVRTKGGQRSVLTTLKSDLRRIWIEALLFRSMSDTLVLCRLHPETENGTQVRGVASALTELYARGGDAVVFTDKDGRILQANSAFQSIANVAVAERLIGASLATYLARPSVDLTVMTTNAEQAGKLSIYATALRTEYGAQIPVEISTTYLPDHDPPSFGFVIRDVSRLEAARQSSSAVSSEAVEHVIELVGSTPLKELVRGTTDVVEKLCIETAIRLTNNNRAAAAEMLGLSRQSLYVKLRRYGLVESDDSVD
ncbi:MAG: transcriptional regulator PpsR [Pseudomonadota bacterium]